MTRFAFIQRTLRHYWRTNAAMAAGIGVAVAALAGALLVGESVRTSLRRLAEERLGNARYTVTAQNFFRASLLNDTVPVIALEASATHDESGRRASKVAVYGVDEQFFRFHGVNAAAPNDREILVSPALAAELGVEPGQGLQVRIAKPSAIPAESLHGRKEDPGRTIRGTVREVLDRSQMGEFALRPQQGEIRAVFVPLERMQREIEQPNRVNLLLSAGAVAGTLEKQWTLPDAGIKLRPIEGGVSVESESMSIPPELAKTVRELAPDSTSVFTYLANTIRANGREIPYSLITAMDLPELSGHPDGLVLNDWAARELGAKPGDRIGFDYYEWHPSGRLLTKTAEFQVVAVVPIKGIAADRTLAPEYPGISDTESLTDWDPPFPMNLSRIRKIDEDYWDLYKTTPKAFIPLAAGQRLWRSRWGDMTSIRVTGLDLPKFTRELRQRLTFDKAGFRVDQPYQQAIAASRGATDFGEYFTYFSFFLIVSAILLAGLFFRFGIEQRISEIGTLRAVGFSLKAIRRLLLIEAALVALAGAVIGVLLALVYAAIVLLGLRTWWVDAVGTRDIALHISAAPLAAGVVTALLLGPLVAYLSIRRLRLLSPRSLAAGLVEIPRPGVSLVLAGVGLVGGFVLIGAGVAGVIPAAGAFFGAGGLLLLGGLAFLRVQLLRPVKGVRSLSALGARYASYRPGRSTLTAALIAFATFMVVSVDSFRKDGQGGAGTGGYALVAESAIPIYYDPNTPEGRENLVLPEETQQVRFVSLRLRPGEDVSCLNLYAPVDPRVVGVPKSLREQKRFDTDWTLLEAASQDGTIPALVDQTSLMYVLHKKVGDVIEVGGQKLRVAGTLHDSIFQSELLIAEEQFLRAFPDVQGFQYFLIDTASPERVTGTIEEALADYGFDAVSTSDRLAAFHRVENTYLATFRMLGALGLLVGTFGLGAVLLRNVLERRRELALLRAVGYTPRHLRRLILSENLFLLGAGIGIGTACALVAVAPGWVLRGGGVPILSILVLLVLVAASGVAASVIATRTALRGQLLEALRTD